MSETEILFSESGASVAFRGPLVVAITDGPDAFNVKCAKRTVAEVQRLRRGSHKDRMIYVYLAGERSGIPSAEAREVASGIGDLIDVGVGIHEGNGFRASAIRAVVTGISMMSRARVKLEIVATVDEAAALVSTRWPEAGSKAEVRGVLDQARAAARKTA